MAEVNAVAQRSSGTSRFQFIAEGERVSHSQSLIGIGVCALVTIAVGLNWSSVFSLRSMIAPVLVSVVGGILIGLLVRRLPALVVAAAYLGGVVVASHVTVLRTSSTGQIGIPSSRSVQLLGQAFRHGWSRVLTTPIPMAPQGDTAPIVVIVMVGAAMFSTLVLLRTRLKLFALIGPLSVLITTRVFGASGRAWWNPTAVLLCGVGAGLAALLRTRTITLKSSAREADLERRPALLSGDRSRGVALGLVIAVLAGFVGSQLPLFREKPADPRRVPPADPAQQEAQNPLSRLSGWAQKPDQVLFRFKAEKNIEIPRWRLAILDTFNGADWLPGNRYIDAGLALPRPPAFVGIDRSASPISASVELADLGDVWLPVPGWPERVEGVAPRVDSSRGVLRLLRASDKPVRYQLTALALLGSAPSELGGLDTSEDSRLRTETPQLPNEFVEAANEIVSNAPSPIVRAKRLEAYLRSLAGFRFNPITQPGHSYTRLSLLLRGGPPLGGQGTSEQYATVFAVLARALGMPTRVVVGFEVPPKTPVDANGFVAVTAGMARAWPEVRFAGVGWVPFAPTPGDSGPIPQDETVFEGAQPQQTTTTATTSIVPSTDAAADTEAELAPTPPADASLWWLWLVACGAVAAGLFVALRAVIDKRRNARRTVGDVRDRVNGAWNDAVLALRAASLPIRDSESAPRFASRAGTNYPQLHELAALHERASFQRAELAPEVADHAWALSDQLRAAVVESLSTSAKLRLSVEPLIPSALMKMAKELEAAEAMSGPRS